MLWAHSARGGFPGQTYSAHVINVWKRAKSNARNAVSFYNGDRKSFVDWVEAAALFHDLGKLDKINQSILKGDSSKPLPIAHEDAGVATLWKLNRKESAVLVAAHHAGLFCKDNEQRERPFRNESQPSILNGIKINKYVDTHLWEYLEAHKKMGVKSYAELPINKQLHRCGFTRRVALSCLVDADHEDTAMHYGREGNIPQVNKRWKERLDALNKYVKNLPEGNTERERYRNKLRKRLFECCLDSPKEPAIRTCDAPVGSGKTTAVMAHLLRIAAEHKPELRHIIIVLPYTSIISQTVDIYRKALTLKGEQPEAVVAEHHHRSEFEDISLRQLATLWKAPIIVTTAVQFFETLGSYHPVKLRKLHELPGSAVFIDEMHAAIPSHLWPQVWRWLEVWTRNWAGHLVLASGSLSRFWELDEYRDVICDKSKTPIPIVPDLVEDFTFRDELKQIEQRRITYRRRNENSKALDCKGVIDFVVRNKLGPRLLIVNTVQTAAVIAQAIRKTGYDVLHLSTALAPIHRNLMIDRVKNKLHYGAEDWILVATSCVEAGMNFSFRSGFRERSSTASLIQVGGRVNRGDEFGEAEVWDLLLQDNRFRNNPSLKVSCNALHNFSVEEINEISSSQLATHSMRRELTFDFGDKALELIKLEEGMRYPSVSQKCRVISNDSRSVIIDPCIAESIRKGEKLPKHKLMNYSVQIWANKIDKLALTPLTFSGSFPEFEIYEWPYSYDPDFLGYMNGVLELEDFISAGGAII